MQYGQRTTMRVSVAVFIEAVPEVFDARNARSLRMLIPESSNEIISYLLPEADDCDGFSYSGTLRTISIVSECKRVFSGVERKK